MSNSQDVNNALREVRDNLEDLRNDFQRFAAGLGKRVEQSLGDGLENARTLANDAGKRAGVLARTAHEEIAERPAATAAVAFGVGLALGLLFARGRR